MFLLRSGDIEGLLEMDLSERRPSGVPMKVQMPVDWFFSLAKEIILKLRIFCRC